MINEIWESEYFNVVYYKTKHLKNNFVTNLFLWIIVVVFYQTDGTSLSLPFLSVTLTYSKGDYHLRRAHIARIRRRRQDKHLICFSLETNKQKRKTKERSDCRERKQSNSSGYAVLNYDVLQSFYFSHLDIILTLCIMVI